MAIREAGVPKWDTRCFGAEALIEAVVRAATPFDTARDHLVGLHGEVGRNTAGVTAAVAVRAERSGLVSCDPAALRRNLRLLVAAGFEMLGVEVACTFPQTHPIGTVTTLKRVSASRVSS
jgi:hypothetical protein